MKQFHPDELSLLAAIHSSPKDDLPRLVYADWLEEHNQPDLAEMIRLGIEASKTCADPRQHPRIVELDRPLRRRYVSPVPERMRCRGWDRGLPRMGLTRFSRENTYRQIFDEAYSQMLPLHSFGIGLRFNTSEGLRGILLHPLMGQVHRLTVEPPAHIAPEHIAILAESFRVRQTGLTFLYCQLRPEIGDAIMSILAPVTRVRWMEAPTRREIDSDKRSTWPGRFAKHGSEASTCFE
ncbi:TIGR02996 domain-containing protein [Fimbriiglobus ruber]|uniref:TIGR02996 domain-containing protein n=1 Tax=Fimbriiglobus ruber TaxID=1908690 RepID=UPI000B4B7239|nr:TIGR02996 domain-containing protein [Fimbriiglobus ruber]